MIEHHKNGAKLTATDTNGWTPLHHAARLEKTQVVKYIVENGNVLIILFYKWLYLLGLI